MGPKASPALRAGSSARRRPSGSNARRRARASGQGLPCSGSSDRLRSADDLARYAEEVLLVGLLEVLQAQIYKVSDLKPVSTGISDPIVSDPDERILQAVPAFFGHREIGRASCRE